MHIDWNKVTPASQIAAIIFGLVIFGLGFWLGAQYQSATLPISSDTENGKNASRDMISDVTYRCDGNRSIHALFYDEQVTLTLSDGRTYNLPHVISGSGARYASEDESYVFWEKGSNAVFTEPTEDGGTDTVSCAEEPTPL